MGKSRENLNAIVVRGGYNGTSVALYYEIFPLPQIYHVKSVFYVTDQDYSTLGHNRTRTVNVVI